MGHSSQKHLEARQETQVIIMLRKVFGTVISRQIRTTPAVNILKREWEGEEREIKAKRLLWQSRKRGISENDLLLSTWFREHEPSLSSEELDTYSNLINSDVNEWDLFYWISKTKPVPEEYDTSVMHSLQKHCANEKREERFQQPAKVITGDK